MSTISISIAMSVSGGELSASLSSAFSAEQVAPGLHSATQSIGTSAEQINLGDLANVDGGVGIRNDDPTNYVEVDSVNTIDSGLRQKIRPGETVFLKPQTTTLYALANTAACTISVIAAKG